MSIVSRLGVCAQRLSAPSLRAVVAASFARSGLCSSMSSAASLSLSTSRSFSSGLLQPGIGRLKQTKKDLTTLLSDEARELTRPDDEEMLAYMSEQGLTASPHNVRNEIILKKSVENVDVSIRFFLEPDGNEDENDPNATQEEQGGQENAEQETTENQNEEQAPKPAAHSFAVDLSISGANGAPDSFIRVYAHADQNGVCVVDSINTNEEACKKSEEAKSMEEAQSVQFEQYAISLEDLPEEAAERLLEMLNDLGIDDRLALFIQQYTFDLRTKQHVEKIKSLKNFISQISV